MSEVPYYYVIKKMDTSDEIMSNVHVSTVLCRILCMSHIMFISSKVERECSIYWHLSDSVATPAGVIIILLTRTLPWDTRGGYLY